MGLWGNIIKFTKPVFSRNSEAVKFSNTRPCESCFKIAIVGPKCVYNLPFLIHWLHRPYSFPNKPDKRCNVLDTAIYYH